MNKKSGQHFAYLDAMRGIAALFVGILHCTNIITPKISYKLPNAHLAVDFFFCLSGFVIAYAYTDKLNMGSFKAKFMRLRLIRLCPLLFIGLSLGAISNISGYALLGNRHELASAVIISIVSMVMIPIGLLFGKEAFPTNNAVWSLFFEIVANAIYAFVTVKNTMQAILMFIIIGILFVLFGIYFSNIEQMGFHDIPLFFAGFPRVAYSFCAGVLIYRLTLYQDRSVIWSWLAVAGLVLMLGFPYGNWMSDLLMIILCIPIIVIAGTATAGPRIYPYLEIMGEISYPFYLIHLPFIRTLGKIGRVRALGLAHPVLTVCLTILPIIILSLLFSRLYDIPVRRYLSRPTVRA